MSWTERWESVAAPRTAAQAARFGFVMAVALGLLGGLLIWKGLPAGRFLLGAGVAFLVLASVAPRTLEPIERGWLWFGERMSRVTTALILGLMYFLVITPIGLLKRAISGDSLGLKPDRSARTHWVPVEPDGPGTRPTKPF